MYKKLIISIILIQQYLFAIDAELDIVRKNTVIPTISVVVVNNSLDVKLINKIKKTIQKDLEVSCHFKIKNNNIMIDDISNLNFASLKEKSDLLLLLKIVNKTNNNLTIQSKLVDLNSNETTLNKKYIISNTNRYPFLSHKIAVNINDSIKAPSINWMERFVIFSRYTSSRKSEVVVSDYSLTYQKVVVRGGLNLFPKWANKEQSSFYYTNYSGDFPTLIKQNLFTSKSKQIISSQGMLVCSDVSYKTNKLLLTMAPTGQPDIYLYDLNTKNKQKLTRYKGIDVGASFIDNEKSIVFISDRLGKANVFSKKIGQYGVDRMVYHGKNNTQVTSFGNYIVYSSRETNNQFSKNSFNLYLISTQSDMTKRLTVTGANKFPKFSSDGESILFTKQYKNKSYLGIVRLNYNKSFQFKLDAGKLQSIDW
jgi:TolB protein